MYILKRVCWKALLAALGGVLAMDGVIGHADESIAARWKKMVKTQGAAAAAAADPSILSRLAADMEAALLEEHPDFYADLTVDLVRSFRGSFKMSGPLVPATYRISTRALDLTRRRVSATQWGELATTLMRTSVQWSDESEADWAARRRLVGLKLLDALAYVRNATDPTWDPRDPAQQAGFSAPFPPPRDADPAARERHRQAVAEHRRKTLRNREQAGLRDFERSAVSGMLTDVLRMYRSPPVAWEEIRELAARDVLKPEEAKALLSVIPE